MKTLCRVAWAEGMYLGPHHFQAQSRYFEDTVEFAVSSLWPDSWGLAGFQLDREALQNGTIAVSHARGIFPDGLPFDMPECDPPPPPRPFAALYPSTQDQMMVSLGVPEEKQSGLNCAQTAEEVSLAVRYVAESRSLTDHYSGRQERPVALGRKNVRVVLEGEDSAGLALIPLARVRRDSSGRFQFDEDYVPPCLRIGASERLMLIVQRLARILEEKAKGIVSPKDLGNPAASGFNAQGIANAWFLHCVNSGLAPLRLLCATPNAHPRQLYTEMARLAGALCTFGLDSHPSQLALYDHQRMEFVFDALDHHIRTHLELIVPSNCVGIPLAQVGAYFFEGRIEDARVLGRARWVLAIRSPIGEADLIEKTPRLVKLSSRETLPKLVNRALPGLPLQHLPVPPPAVSARVDSQYFSVDRAGPLWEYLVQSRQLALYVPGEIPQPEVELFAILESG